MARGVKRIFAKWCVPSLFVIVATAVSLVGVEEVCNSYMLVEEPVVDPYARYEQEEYEISPYDNLFRTIAAEYKLDWRLMSAMANAESRFERDVVSRSGAVGLMQIMPFVASAYGYEREELFNPEINVRVAAELVRSVYSMLRLPRDMEHDDRLAFMLACYNAGYSRVADARDLAEYYGDDADRWEVVKDYLPLLADPEFYENEVVESGCFTGSRETIGYVRKVMRRYEQYCRRVAI